jgi:hypothetical protein
VCGGSQARLYICAAEENPSNVGHAHVARLSQLQQPAIWERSEPTTVTRPLKTLSNSVILWSKKISSARDSILQTAARACHDVSCRDERGGGACVSMWYSYSHSLTKWCKTPPYMLIYIPPNFLCGLNLAPTSCLCAAKTWVASHMGFEISRNF